VGCVIAATNPVGVAGMGGLFVVSAGSVVVAKKLAGRPDRRRLQESQRAKQGASARAR